MGRRSVFIIISILIMIICGCGANNGSSDIEKKVEESDPWGITLNAEIVSDKGITLVCEQKDGNPTGELYTGSWYVLEKLVGGTWTEMEYVPQDYEVGWTSEAWLIEKNKVTKWEVDWKWLYGELAVGKYRIGKSVDDFRGTGVYDTKVYYAEFEITEEIKEGKTQHLGELNVKGSQGEVEKLNYVAFREEYGKYYIEIKNKKDDVLQIIDYVEDEWNNPNYIYEVIKIQDVNGDGSDDIWMDLGSYGNQGIRHWACFVYNQESSQFIEVEGFPELENPEVESMLRCWWRNGAMEYGISQYHVDGNRLEKYAELTVLSKQNDDGTVETVYDEIYYENGEVISKNLGVNEVDNEFWEGYGFIESGKGDIEEISFNKYEGYLHLHEFYSEEFSNQDYDHDGLTDKVRRVMNEEQKLFEFILEFGDGVSVTFGPFYYDYFILPHIQSDDVNGDGKYEIIFIGEHSAATKLSANEIILLTKGETIEYLQVPAFDEANVDNSQYEVGYNVNAYLLDNDMIKLECPAINETVVYPLDQYGKSSIVSAGMEIIDVATGAYYAGVTQIANKKYIYFLQPTIDIEVGYVYFLFQLEDGELQVKGMGRMAY